MKKQTKLDTYPEFFTAGREGKGWSWPRGYVLFRF